MCKCVVISKFAYAYRVTLVVAHLLGWVDCDLGQSTACPFLLGQMGIWLN